MEALREEAREVRAIFPYLESALNANGVRENDQFVLDVIQEKKKTFKLNRTHYTISLGAKYDFDFIKSKITLPVFDGLKGDFKLELISTFHAKGYDHRSRYLLKSLGNTPFKHNGNFTFESFLERGDVVDLGFNRLHFHRPEVLAMKSIVLSPEEVRSVLPVLIEGETGTGKTTLAKKIHEESGRSGQFVHLNLSAFSKSLIESELFGHVKGAFTGALNAKKGAILEAHKGTLFLDEIDSLSIDLQTKLLLFLDSYEIRAVGGESKTTAQVRVIFASGSDLKKLVSSGKMRKDFYFRLRAGSFLRLPSLREDKNKIRELCCRFEKEHFSVMPEEMISFYMSCPWPGNIRQLQSHLMQKKILSGGKKWKMDDSDRRLLLEEGESFGEVREIQTMEKMKTNYCYEAYLMNEKNLTKTAKILELSQNTLKAYLAKKEMELRDDKVVHINFKDLPFDS